MSITDMKLEAINKLMELSNETSVKEVLDNLRTLCTLETDNSGEEIDQIFIEALAEKI
jgi:hypothetical protein